MMNVYKRRHKEEFEIIPIFQKLQSTEAKTKKINDNNMNAKRLIQTTFKNKETSTSQLF